MANYFRITAYSPAEDVGMIVDSNGKFEKIWQFSSCLVKKGFDILEVSKSENFTDGNIPPHARERQDPASRLSERTTRPKRFTHRSQRQIL